MVARDDPDCKAIVIRGNGRAFCAGYDITPDIGYGSQGRMIRGESDPRLPGSTSAAERFSQSHRETYKCDFFRSRIYDNPKPIICAVHGFCIAGGNDYSTKTDLIFASPDALFGYNILRNGPRGGIAPHTFAPWLFGARKSKEICFTGNLFSAEEMYFAGAINKVILKEHFEDYVDNIARHIATLPSVVISLSKRAINFYYDMLGKREYEDYAEAMRAFAGTWIGKPDEYASLDWDKATRAKGLSYHLRERDKPFWKSDAWWRQAVAARPKYDTGTKENCCER
jgi:enoyl-CoA hydratase